MSITYLSYWSPFDERRKRFSSRFQKIVSGPSSLLFVPQECWAHIGLDSDHTSAAVVVFSSSIFLPGAPKCFLSTPFMACIFYPVAKA